MILLLLFSIYIISEMIKEEDYRLFIFDGLLLTFLWVAYIISA